MWLDHALEPQPDVFPFVLPQGRLEVHTRAPRRDRRVVPGARFFELFLTRIRGVQL